MELRAEPILYLKLKEGETKEQAIERMTNLLYEAGFDILNETITTENTQIQDKFGVPIPIQ